MAPLLQSFLHDLLSEADGHQSSLVSDEAVLPDSALLVTLRKKGLEEDNQRSVNRHHSNPVLGSSPQQLPASTWSCSNAPMNPTRWDAGTGNSAVQGHNSNPQLIFPLRTCDDSRYINTGDRWSVARHHSDSLLAMPRPCRDTTPNISQNKQQLESLPKKDTTTMPSSDVETRTTKTPAQNPRVQRPTTPLKTSGTWETEITWHRSRPSIRRRNSLRSQKKRLPHVQEMEIIWERENPVEKQHEQEEPVVARKNNCQSSLMTLALSYKQQMSMSLGYPSFLSCSEKSTVQLLETAWVLIHDFFPPKIVFGNSSPDVKWDSFYGDTILDVCGGDIGPAARQLEYHCCCADMSWMTISEREQPDAK